MGGHDRKPEARRTFFLRWPADGGGVDAAIKKFSAHINRSLVPSYQNRNNLRLTRESIKPRRLEFTPQIICVFPKSRAALGFILDNFKRRNERRRSGRHHRG